MVLLIAFRDEIQVSEFICVYLFSNAEWSEFPDEHDQICFGHFVAGNRNVRLARHPLLRLRLLRGHLLLRARDQQNKNRKKISKSFSPL
jgi:hypothetical protein